MPDWKPVLQKFVRCGDGLPGDLREGFRAEPPAGRPWQRGLPSSPSLRAFYSLCDGGSFYRFEIDRQEDLEDLRDWSGDGEFEAGRYLVFGTIGIGQPLVWDSAQDRVGYHDQDGADGLVMSDETGLELMGLTLDEFLEGLFSRPPAGRGDRSDEVSKLWAETLDGIDRLPERGDPADRPAAGR